MSTTANSLHNASTSKTQLSSYDAFLERLKFSYFGLICMTITFGSCLGGIAAMCTLQNEAPIWQLAVCMTAAMANNVAAIGQAPIKWLVNIFCITTLANIIMLLINL